MRSLGNKDYDLLHTAATESPRKREHLNLHSSFEEKVQRVLISLSKGSFVEPHYHSQTHQWEMFVVLEGWVKVVLYRRDGSVLEVLHVGEGHEVNLIEFQPQEIHSVECMSERALMIEIKEGPFDPSHAKTLAPFIS
ncbi:WbuC family cupin fold metalloprotein [Vibrio coralliilyticus]|uniref:WbuC family cupin fold metalloprotein n=1 Tax=Vibrio coralliilyticus TaxID=190893 RepID=UPI003916F1CD